ncbi:DUF721 domain-containing protein [Pseudodesulfovibrio sp. JC047]|uniref:DUF721 domain-containing protein n=1 Tax=Pseudodesulfovibrio sp. JC047 TaxID=2683199 RepID=UPI0013CFBD4C|nr:DUF721 domain-containing protein [Pseudodesulfovibrio sp. JC047]NDV20211.1 DUF721 domain-containing protein [Pseudodesulfovibrio sp. JC047]
MRRSRRKYNEYTSRPGPRKTSDLMPRFLDKLDTTGGAALVRLWRSWDDLMGEMAAMARPLGHRGTRIVLAAQDPIVMQEAQYLAPMMLQKINEYLGEEVFDKVVFELLNGRVPLDEVIRPEAPEPPRKLKRPKNLGHVDDQLDPDSPVGKCYRAYRRMFDDKD